MTAPQCRGIDVSDNQLPAAMRYGEWRRLGFIYLYYQVSRGLTPTPHAAEHRRLARANNYATGPYMELEGWVDARAQARLLLSARDPADELPDMVAVELSLTEPQLRAFCDEHDRSGIDLAIYTGFGVWERTVPLWAARARYAKYKLIFASYPYDAPESPAGQPMDAASIALRSTPPAHVHPMVPAPWVDWWSWQHSGHGRLPGYDGDLDLEVSSMSEAELRASLGAAPTPALLYPGAMYGFHGEGSNQIIPIMRRLRELGVRPGPLLSVENPGRCVDAKGVDPRILTIARFKQPKALDRWEGGQDADTWSAAERLDFARHCIQMIFDRTNPTERAAVDFWVPGYNEWNPPGDWTGVGETFKVLCNEATQRSAEFGRPIRLALPGLAQGTPQYWQMQQMVATGLFDLMKSRGDLFLVHEGRYRWESDDADQGLGDLIPGAPACPAGAGSGAWRALYWYSLGVAVPWVSSETYDGYDSGVDPATRLAYMRHYDRHARSFSRWYRGACWFELVDNDDSSWRDTDFTRTFQAAVMEADMLAQKDELIPLESDTMPIISAADLSALSAAVNTMQSATATANGILARYRPAAGKHTMSTLTNQDVINVFSRTFNGLAVLSRINMTVPLADNRGALYTGPAVEDLALTDAEKAALISALGAPAG